MVKGEPTGSASPPPLTAYYLSHCAALPRCPLVPLNFTLHFKPLLWKEIKYAGNPMFIYGDNHSGLKINNEPTRKKFQTLLCTMHSKWMILKPKYLVVAILFDGENELLKSRPTKILFHQFSMKIKNSCCNVKFVINRFKLQLRLFNLVQYSMRTDPTKKCNICVVLTRLAAAGVSCSRSKYRIYWNLVHACNEMFDFGI